MPIKENGGEAGGAGGRGGEEGRGKSWESMDSHASLTPREEEKKES